MAAKSNFNYVVVLASGQTINIQSDSSAYVALSVSDGASTVALKFAKDEFGNLATLLNYLNGAKRIDSLFNPA